MTAPLTPERLAEIRPLAKRYLTEWPNRHAQIDTGNQMAMRWEQLVDQAAEVARLRARETAVYAWCDQEMARNGSTIALEGVLAALASGDEVQP